MPKVLIIDDEECIRETLGEFAELLGYEPILAYDPQLNLPCVDKLKCPMECACAESVLVDHYLPTTFGVSFLEKMKHKGCKIPDASKAVITTVLTSEEAERVNALGSKVIHKPVTFSKFNNWLSSINNDLAPV